MICDPRAMGGSDERRIEQKEDEMIMLLLSYILDEDV